ncbi:MAG: Do family serine endopeptidase [Cocleimonas sp.]|nr:Do family serine endopeptidase [Cocleimonas sp.]
MSNTLIAKFLATFALLLLVRVAITAELPNFTQLVKAHSAAVVNISTEREDYQKPASSRTKTAPEDGNNEMLDDLMKRFFDESNGDEDDPSSLGSGFIISSDGYVVTNYHVVDGADKIIVKLSDRRELSALLIGSDKRSDIALLKIEGDKFPVLKIGSSKRLEVGEWVIAIGSPFGFDHSVTAGIVSAKGRSLPEENYVPFIQTDVAINPGNSGGPLFNMKGEVVGINSQIYSQSGGFMGLSFAIPVDVVKDVVAQLKATGHVRRGWLGVYIQEVTVGLAKSFGLNEPSGALVAEVIKKGPAVSILQQGDIILEFNHKKVAIASDLPIIVGGTPIDKEVNVKIRRGGSTKIVQLTLGELPAEATAKKQKKPKRKIKFNTVMGMELDNLTERNRKELKIKEGVLVVSVGSGAARKAGMQAGDIIRRFNGHSVKNIKQLKLLVNSLPNSTPVAGLVLRDGTPQFVAFMVEHKIKQ